MFLPLVVIQNEYIKKIIKYLHARVQNNPNFRFFKYEGLGRACL